MGEGATAAGAPQKPVATTLPAEIRSAPPILAEKTAGSGSTMAGLASGFGLAAILLLAASLRLWRLDRNGWGTEYYTAGVRSMTESWHNFFFNAFDPAGFISLDKPPVAFWIQVASAKLFGFTGLSILVPQVLEGVIAIVLLYHLVRRRFGVPAGLLAALFLAMTPVSVAVDRSSNTDSCLVLTLLLAAWPLICAAERGSLPLLVLSMVLVGIGFNVKMAAALVVVPSFMAVFFIAAPGLPHRRLAQLLIASVALVGVSLSWITVYDLTPEDSRPFVGSSQGNSMFELAIGHNALARFVHRHRAFGNGAEARAADGTMAGPNTADPDAVAAAAGTVQRGRENVPVGPLRLADPRLASQVGWLLPLAVMGLLAVVWRSWPVGRRDPASLSLLLWWGWVATCVIVYSAAGGIFHSYYVLPVAPPLCALAGVGTVSLIRLYRRGGRHADLLLLSLLLTALWQVYIQNDYLGAASGQDNSVDWLVWLNVGLLAGAACAIGGLILARAPGLSTRASRLLAAGAISIGLVALLAMPAAWALSSVLGRGNVSFPVADVRLLAPEGSAPRWRGGAGIADPAATQKLVAFLDANRHGERYLLATVNARQAAPLIIRTGDAVMAVGGYSGTDAVITPGEAAQLVAAGEVRFALIGEPEISGQAADIEPRQAAFIDWVRKTGRPVDPALWRAAPAASDAQPDALVPQRLVGRRERGSEGRTELFDLRPPNDPERPNSG